MKKIIVGIFLVLYVLSLVACETNNTAVVNETTTDHVISTTSASSIVASQDVLEPSSSNESESIHNGISGSSPLESSKLSDECDYILASGYDEKGSFFELVACVIDDYNGSVMKIGVIKDNQWLRDLSSKSPFLKDGKLKESYEYDRTISYTETKFEICIKCFEYVGLGCFLYGDRYIYNAINDLFLDVRTIDGYIASTGVIYSDFGPADGNERGNVLLVRDYYGECFAVNTLTMKSTHLDIFPTDVYNEGVFASYNKFYNLDGEVEIDLSKYNIYGVNLRGFYLIFHEGICTFKIKNDIGSIYELTIDRKGNVINSVKVSDE